jgi:cell growth-regulating nucleolar protein
MSLESLLTLEELLQEFEFVLTCPHTQSCISEAQKYQGKLYKEPKKKGAPVANNNSKQPPSPAANSSQALVPTKPPMEVPEADNRVAIVDAPPRAPSPPPGFNVFDFLVQNGETNSTHPLESPPSSPSSSEVSSSSEDEESDPDSMDTDDNDLVTDAAEAAREYMKQEMLKQGYMFGEEQRFEQFQSYTQFPPSPAGQSGQFETPAPRPSHHRNISTTSVDSTTKESTKKRKRGHPEDLDLSSARAYKTNGDIVMTDVAPPLHSGLTGGLNRLLSRPELPPSPPDLDGSPQSPLKRSKQAKLDNNKKTKEKERAKKVLSEKEKDKEAKKSSSKTTKDEKKEKKKPTTTTTTTSSVTVTVRDPKTGQWVRRRVRKDSTQQQQPQEQTSEHEQPARKQLKAIEYHPTTNGDDKLKPTANNAMVLHSKKAIARAEVFLTAAAKDTESERGCSLNKALKRYYRDHASRKNSKDEKELWKVLRVRKNDRGELVLFVDGQD